MKKGSYLSEVKNQYENYPYPPRDPNSEKGRLISAISSSLDIINFYCFEGKRDLTKDFRVLIPGGGTGDCTIYLAEQLRGTNAEIVYLDMSDASISIAKERAKIRQLDNITWIHDSILNIPKLDLGKFDYISCTGVLHHLADPKAGLDALASVLHPEGSMFIMLYAQFARTAIYQMQEALRRINANVEDIEQTVVNAKKILKALPPGNWMNFNMPRFAMDLQSDIGLYDLLLHSQDRAYTIPELYDFIEASGLVINKLIEKQSPMGNLIFKPETFIKDPTLLETVKALSEREQMAITESLYGQTSMQNCFISFKNKQIPSLDDIDYIPFIGVTYSQPETLDFLKNAYTDTKQNIALNQMVTIGRTPHAASFFKLIDGKRSIKEIIEQAIKTQKSNISFEDALKEFKATIGVMYHLNLISLKAKGIPKTPTIPEMDQRMHTYYGKKKCEEVLKNTPSNH